MDTLLIMATIYYGGLNMFRIEHNVETGEIKEIPLTAAEIKAIEKLQKENEPALIAEKAEAEAKAAQRQVILDKLGLTADEARLLLG